MMRALLKALTDRLAAAKLRRRIEQLRRSVDLVERKLNAARARKTVR